jgi:hypothetical protein
MNPLPHVMIGDTLWYRLHLPDVLRPAILLGSTAPDAYRLVPGLGYRPTHFQSPDAPGDPIGQFCEQFLQPALVHGSLQEQAFRMGWLGHLVADDVWRRLLKEQAPDIWAACTRAEPQRRVHQRGRYRDACAAADRGLAAAQPEYTDALRRLLAGARPEYPVSPLTPSVLMRWTVAVVRHAMPPRAVVDDGAELIAPKLLRRAIEQSCVEAMAVILREQAAAASAEDSSIYF